MTTLISFQHIALFVPGPRSQKFHPAVQLLIPPNKMLSKDCHSSQDKSQRDESEGKEEVLVAEGDGPGEAEVLVGLVDVLVLQPVHHASLVEPEDVVVEEFGELWWVCRSICWILNFFSY